MISARELFFTLPFDEIPHRSKSLRDHLQGTFDILVDWGLNEEVCLAGLFHSALGTPHFSGKPLLLRELLILNKVLPPYSVNLVRLFSVIVRPDSLIGAIPHGRLQLRNLGQSLNIELGVLSDLITIEYANLLEQGEDKLLIDELNTLSVEILKPLLSEPVMRAWGNRVLP